MSQRIMLFVVVFVYLACQITADNTAYATCHIQPNPDGTALYDISGMIHFKQEKGSKKVHYKVNLSGFDTGDGIMGHAHHVHTYGTIGMACDSAGGHFNPSVPKLRSKKNKPWKMMVGDLGNLMEDNDGNIVQTLMDKDISLLKRKTSILGRALVIHAGPDDLGTHMHGHATAGAGGGGGGGGPGLKIACCIIAVSDGSAWGDGDGMDGENAHVHG